MLTAVIWIMSLPVIWAQPDQLASKKIVFEKLPENLGLSQSSINTLLQDRDGYLWIGTWSGLIRYDGYNTTVYHSDNTPGTLKSNLISTLYEDSFGHIWVGTHMGGLFDYDKSTNRFTQYKHDPKQTGSISDNNIWKIIEDERHNLWVGTEHGLNYFDRNTQTFTGYFVRDGDPKALTDDFVTDVFIDSQKQLWVATNFGLNRLVQPHTSEQHFEKYYDAQGDMADNFVYEVGEVNQRGKQIIWFITKKGLRSLEDGKIRSFVYPDRASNYSLFRVMLPVQGQQPLLLLGSAMGLSFFDPSQQTFTRFFANFDEFHAGLPAESMSVTALYMDRGGVLWVGTKKGLYKCDTYKKEFDLFLTATFDPTNSILTGIRPLGQDNYWVSTIGGGLFQVVNKTFKRIRIPLQQKGEFAGFIQSLYTDSRGRVWVGTAGAGMVMFDPADIDMATGTVRRYRHYHLGSTPALNDDYVVSFTEDKQGQIWVGTWRQGLACVVTPAHIIQYKSAEFTSAPPVVLHTDNAGAIWIGTRGSGAYRLRSRQGALDIRHYHHEQSGDSSLINDFVNAIYEDHAGGLWFATEGGLAFFDRRAEAFKPFPIPEGPTNNVIVGILEDDEGKLWLSHWNGITVIDPADRDQRQVEHFDTHDRIQGGFFYNNVCYKDAAGNLLFGGSNGLNIIKPSSISHNPIQPNVVITHFSLFNKPVEFGQTVNDRVILQAPLTQAGEVELKHHENTLSFEFAALDFAAPEKIKYAYRLEGFTNDWTYTDATRRFAHYTNLNSGTYTFRVRATNHDGVWHEKSIALRVVILPPWWKTPWAFFIYVLLTILVLHGFRKLVLMRANFMHDIKLERVQRENLENLNRAKLQFFTNISHEFRTPLTLILGPVQSLMDSGEGGKFVRDQLLSINNNAQRLLRLVNQLLDFRKAETGNLKLEVAEGNLVKFIKEVKLSFDPLAEQMNIHFAFHTSSNIIRAWFDRDQFEKILFNLLSNAFKHTPEGGTVAIHLAEQNQEIVIQVENSGKGIRPEHFEYIFQSFFSYDEDRHQTGTGIGLALTKSLVDAHHGTISVESVEQERTCFTVRIPAGRDHFDDTEISALPGDDEPMEQYPMLVPQTPATPAEQPPPTADTIRILIVEDNAEVRTYVRSMFIGTYYVLEAQDGQAGLALAQEETPDIIISDVMMPVMDGITLCRQLKSNVKTSHIPIILLTARTSLIFKVEGLETGADDYVTKPFNPTVLQLKVRNLLRTRDKLRQLFQDNQVLNIEPSRVTLNSADEKFIGQALDSIERNMSNPEYSVEELGMDVGMSRMQLYRKLKALTGQSANEFIRSIRLKRAAQLLEQHQLTIAEVTYEVGFNDLQYFRECFKKQFGVTPSEYAQQHGGKGEGTTKRSIADADKVGE